MAGKEYQTLAQQVLNYNRKCINYGNATGNCLINCPKEDVKKDTDCPFEPEDEQSCHCFKGG